MNQLLLNRLLLKPLIRVATAGHVDDGKSTLLGQLLVHCGAVPRDVRAGIAKSSAEFVGGFDFSLVTDGLSAEQEQRITIDVAYRSMETEAARVLWADAPGHVQYLKNLATAASTADALLFVVDVRNGVSASALAQLRWAYALGVRQIVVAVNKMDLVGYSADVFAPFCDQFGALKLPFVRQRLIPVSALEGEQLFAPSARMPWFEGPTLLQALSQLNRGVEDDRVSGDHRVGGDARGVFVEVQMVQRFGGRRWILGTLRGGRLCIGSAVRLGDKPLTAKVERLLVRGQASETAQADDAVSILLSEEWDVSKGDILLATGPDLTREAKVTRLNDFSADVLWFSQQTLFSAQSRSLWLRLSNQWTKANVEATQDVAWNTQGQVRVRLSEPVFYSSDSRELSRAVLVDVETAETVGALVNISSMAKTLAATSDAAFTSANSTSAKTVLLTGLPASGKSTLAEALKNSLNPMSRWVWLDGDRLREGLCKGLGFSDADRFENLRRMAEVAALFNAEGLNVICSFIAPLRAQRELVRDIVGAEKYLEVFVDAPAHVCEQRDPKGLYRLKREGKIPNLTGTATYEAPNSPDLHLQTDQLSIAQCLQQLQEMLA